MPKTANDVVKQAIVEFDWENFGMPKPESDEYAEVLARSILAKLPGATEYEDFVVACTELIPEGYDGDEAAESIVLRYLRDMDSLGGILARLTSSYR